MMPAPDAGSVLRIGRDEGNVTITLARPSRRNALTLAGMKELTAAVAQLGHAKGTRSIIVTGDGAFCAGADLRDVVERRGMTLSDRRADVRDVAQALVRALVGTPVPLLAAIDGPAVGLGFDLALACDDLLFGRDGWAMQGWGRIGAVPGTGGELLLRRRNPGLLWRLLADQPRIDGAMAERWGIGEAVTDGTALDAARRRARALAALPIPALHAYVELSREPLRQALGPHLAVCADVQPRLLADESIAGRVDGILGNAQPSNGGLQSGG